jgi:ABC-type dipeptide/oligopeptide/nickel transport system ATPase component
MPPPKEGWQRSRIVALFAQETAAREAVQLLSAQDFFAGCDMVGVQAVADQDWVRLTQSQFAPVDITPDFWIVPTWHEPPAQAKTIIERYQVKASGPQALAQSLSGGNLQKFIVGREVDAAPKLLIVSQPTWGVDVGATAQIRAALLALRMTGCAVLLVSEELDELLELCDRLHVMAQGRLSPSVSRAHANVAQIGSWMSGLWDPVQEAAH